MRLPSGKNVTRNTPINRGSYFTWGEVTKNCTRKIETLYINGQIIISAKAIEKNIKIAATQLDLIRVQLGNRPIRITSWYRPRGINQRVGGSKWSRHQYGDAVDLQSDYYSPRQLRRILEKGHTTGGYSTYPGFTHIDWRGERARW